MGHLTNEEFFVKLGELFAGRKGKDHGALYMMQKRLTYGREDAAKTIESGEDSLVDLNPPEALPIIIRVSNGKSREARTTGEKVKLSTLVDPDALDAFYGRYAEVCKAGMTSLKPRDRSKKKAKAKKRKGGTAAGTTS